MKKNKIVSLVVIIVTLLSVILPTLQNVVYAEDYEVDYQGSVTYGESKVGKFYIAGQRAFCIDHKKATPNNGTIVTNEIYKDDNILKCLYYGIDGDEPWCFESEEQGIVYTTLALDHFVNGNRNSIAQEFIDYVNAKDAPEIILDFSKRILNSYITEDNIQRTESISIEGDPKCYLTIPLPEGVTLVNETKGTTGVGNVDVYGEDRFYLKAPLSINGTWYTDNIQNNKYNYHPIIYRTNNNSLQRLASGYKIIQSGRMVTDLTVNWLSLGQLEIYKKDEETGKAISNTKFEIINEKGIVVDTITTNSKGYAKSNNLVAGKYILKEIQANDKYILDDTPIEITIKTGETKTINMTNKHKKGKLKIVKVDSRDNKTPISNVTFEIWKTETNQKIATKTTGKDGTILIDNLEIGTYKVKEISTNEWYALNEQTNEVEIEWNNTSELVISNNVKKGYIEIIKQDVDYSDIKLENVKFEIRNSKGKLVDTLITDKKGYAKSKLLPIDEKYEVKETQASPKYIVSSDIENVTFTPKENNKQLIITNRHKQGKIKVVKVDEDNNKIAIGGVEFELYSEEFKKVVGTYTTNSNGEIIIENLRIGNYKLKEISTNKWYNLADTVEVIVEENKTKEVVITNELKKGQVKVIKVDKDNKEIRIPNVIFEVQDKNGKVLEKIVTNENGEALTKKYPIRDFKELKLKEIQTGELYVLNEELVQVELEANKITETTIENEMIRGQIKIIKTSKEDNYMNGDKAGTPIPNVKFEIYNANRELMDTISTDEEGIAVTKKMVKGVYIIKEVETGEAYLLDVKEYIVKLTKYDEMLEVKITNEPKKPEKKLPRTGF